MILSQTAYVFIHFMDNFMAMIFSDEHLSLVFQEFDYLVHAPVHRFPQSCLNCIEVDCDYL